MPMYNCYPNFCYPYATTGASTGFVTMDTYPASVPLTTSEMTSYQAALAYAGHGPSTQVLQQSNPAVYTGAAYGYPQAYGTPCFASVMAPTSDLRACAVPYVNRAPTTPELLPGAALPKPPQKRHCADPTSPRSPMRQPRIPEAEPAASPGMGHQHPAAQSAACRTAPPAPAQAPVHAAAGRAPQAGAAAVAAPTEPPSYQFGGHTAATPQKALPLDPNHYHLRTKASVTKAHPSSTLYRLPDNPKRYGSHAGRMAIRVDAHTCSVTTAGDAQLGRKRAKGSASDRPAAEGVGESDDEGDEGGEGGEGGEGAALAREIEAAMKRITKRTVSVRVNDEQLRTAVEYAVRRSIRGNEPSKKELEAGADARGEWDINAMARHTLHGDTTLNSVIYEAHVLPMQQEILRLRRQVPSPQP
jgi:hypothetical protein